MISEQPATVSTCVFQSVAPKESLSVYCWSRDPTFLYSVTRHVAVTCSLMPHICVTRPHQWRDATSRPACHCLFATRDRFKGDHLRRSASEKLFAIYVHALRMCNRVLPRVCTLLVLVGMTSWTVPMARTGSALSKMRATWRRVLLFSRTFCCTHQASSPSCMTSMWE